jgi:hypothetical protein
MILISLSAFQSNYLQNAGGAAHVFLAFLSGVASWRMRTELRMPTMGIGQFAGQVEIKCDSLGLYIPFEAKQANRSPPLYRLPEIFIPARSTVNSGCSRVP